MALSFIVGIPSGRSFPLAFGIYIRLNGLGLYPLRLRWNMASHLLSGVLHSFLSTPGVLRPGFSVTRFTARVLAENERTNKRCRDLTLRHCLFNVAFAILICSFLTFDVGFSSL